MVLSYGTPYFSKIVITLRSLAMVIVEQSLRHLASDCLVTPICSASCVMLHLVSPISLPICRSKDALAAFHLAFSFALSPSGLTFGIDFSLAFLYTQDVLFPSASASSALPRCRGTFFICLSLSLWLVWSRS
jgi:hypothetical protein